MTVSDEHAARQAEIQQHVERMDRDGYSIIENAFSADLADELIADLERLEHDLAIRPATNGFEGTSTWRIYNLLARGALYAQIPVHPIVFPVLQATLGQGMLVSSLSSIAIGPGEIAQPIHADDQIIPLPKPHPATVANSMWALTDFTAANGATRIIPGTHTADHSPTYGADYDSIPAEMAKGSILVWHGSLWHGGGANHTDARRYGIAMNYCAGWIRQQENQQLGVPLAIVDTFTPQLRELCGFEVYNGLIGHIDKQPPSQHLLGAQTPSAMVWDRG